MPLLLLMINYFKGKAKVTYDANAKLRDNDFWAAHRTTQLTKSEAGMDSFIKRMASTKAFQMGDVCVQGFDRELH